MLAGSKEYEDRSGEIVKFYKNEFYDAIMDEDVGRLEDMSKKYGSNFDIEKQGGAPGGAVWKVNVTMQTFLLITAHN